MPSIVLLMRSRFRMRPRSFSMRMPSSSSYWRLILRRPASSLGRSSWPSSVWFSSPSKMENALDLPVPLLSLFRARAMAGLYPPSGPKRVSAGPLAVAAVLVAHPVEAPRAEAGELHDAALGPAGRTQALSRRVAALLGRLGLLALCHACGGEKMSRLWELDGPP